MIRELRKVDINKVAEICIMYPYVWTLLKVEPHPLDNLKIDVPTEWTPSYNCSDLMVFYLQEKEMYHHEQEAIYR